MTTSRPADAMPELPATDSRSLRDNNPNGRRQTTRVAAISFPVALTFLLLLPLVVNSSIEAVLLTCLMYAFLATAWNVIGGFAGQLALGNALFFGIGAYLPAVAMVEYGIPATVAAVAAIPVAAVVAALVGWLTFRSGLRGVYFAVATLVTAELARVLVKNVGILGRSEGLFILRKGPASDLSFSTDRPLYYVWLAALVVAVALVTIMARHRFGYFLLALRDEEAGARGLGIPVDRCKRWAFIFSAALTSLGGSLYVMTYRSVQPDQHLALTPLTLATLVAAILGGRGTVVGPVIGGFALGFIQFGLTYLGSSVGEVWFFSFVQVLYGALLMALILFAPRGLWGSLRSVFMSSDRSSFRVRMKESP